MSSAPTKSRYGSWRSTSWTYHWCTAISPFGPMAPRQAGPLLYLEDLRVGQRFETGACTVSEGDITAFADQFDPQPFHLDGRAARDSVFGGIVASGWHTAAITMRLLVES